MNSVTLCLFMDKVGSGLLASDYSKQAYVAGSLRVKIRTEIDPTWKTREGLELIPKNTSV
jgi:hypothetical protein